ncbi:hypothetical protein DENSPDRAFT_851588 [Dentipellis sp. KUC8613]|nr:hypothetical protein DENSPDRAFT_851588 [Dentipellis sp. KUC8613]
MPNLATVKISNIAAGALVNALVGLLPQKQLQIGDQCLDEVLRLVEQYLHLLPPHSLQEIRWRWRMTKVSRPIPEKMKLVRLNLKAVKHIHLFMKSAQATLKFTKGLSDAARASALFDIPTTSNVVQPAGVSTALIPRFRPVLDAHTPQLVEGEPTSSGSGSRQDGELLMVSLKVTIRTAPTAYHHDVDIDTNLDDVQQAAQ